MIHIIVRRQDGSLGYHDVPSLPNDFPRRLLSAWIDNLNRNCKGAYWAEFVCNRPNMIAPFDIRYAPKQNKMTCYQDVLIGGELTIIHECPYLSGPYGAQPYCRIDKHPLMRIEGDTVTVSSTMCPK